MLHPNSSDTDAARVALLPLECSRPDIDKLFASLGEPEEFANRFEGYGLTTLKGFSGPDEPPRVNSIPEIATFSALASVRTEFDNPLLGNEYYEQFPENSVERRMMEHPLRKHPGLTRYVRDIRMQYVYDVLYTFQHLLNDELQCEFAATLVAPDPERSSSSRINPAATYHSNDDKPGSVQSRYMNRLTRTEDGFLIPFSHVSGRSFNEPVGDRVIMLSSDFDDLPAITRHENGFLIPEDVILAKLANYAWHGWFRLAHRVYNGLSEMYIRHLVEATPKISEQIKDHLRFQKPHRSFVPYYGSSAENPLMDPGARDPISRPDKRLLTVVDAIRASSDLEFGEPIQLTRLFDEVRRFYPSPDRPSNDVSNVQTLQNALDRAIDNRLSSSNTRNAYNIPAPFPTPFHPDGMPTLWKQYRHELAELTRTSLNIPDTRHISPYLPEKIQPRNSQNYAETVQKTERAAATQLKHDAWEPHTVRPLVNPGDIDSLSPDEILFLTKIGLAMERRIRYYSLADSMRAFDETTDGETLNIDVEELENRGYLTRPPGRRTYYSVPPKTRRLLGIPNVSHDGWGERSPSEGTRHRVGVDLSAFFVATHPGVDRVVRYCDIWRLRNTACWDAVSHLNGKRLDVVGFSRGEPRMVCEVETKSGDKTGTRGTVEKLGAFPNNVQRIFVTPSGNHLPALMSRLSGSDYFDIDFGATQNGGYRPAKVRAKLDTHDVLGEKFDSLLTYDNVRTHLPEGFARDELSDLIVGIV